ncbi:hypothetical protein C8046_11570 [Serinibacter arcticus]|uniref:YbjN domain-containing protein n=1 Tax=Serinibacter arcticus TaxID=1655435 RepID=A0A2U1ZW43_9MICO|nr:hypothetical protein [Serinibacter arcticus]PWD51191.1 hypothetical protein C8046_11570 [Serinibacter arcticus]
MTDPSPHSSETDLDASTATAWSQFTEELVELIDENGSRSIGIFVEEGAATVNRLRIDCEGDDVFVLLRGNIGLPPALRLSRAAMAQARRRGWMRAAVASKHYARYFRADAAAEAADAVTTALVEVLGVLHPAFLTVDDLPETPRSVAPEPVAPRPRRGPTPLASGVRPTDARHLDRLVEETLGAVLGREVRRGECGEIEIEAGDASVDIEWSTARLIVPMTALITTAVDDVGHALAVVNDLNRFHQGVTFVLHGRAVVARLDFPASRFDGALLVNELANLCDLVIEQGPAIATRLEGAAR